MLEIKFTIDVSDKVVTTVTELAQILRTADDRVLPNILSAKIETPKAETPKAETPKAETPKAETPKAETPKAETPKAETPKGDLTIEEVRALLRMKVNNDENRVKCKDKLESFGAANVTTLDKKYYPDFYSFMKQLP